MICDRPDDTPRSASWMGGLHSSPGFCHLALGASARVGTCVRHDADPVINPPADRAETLRLGRVVPARLLDARLDRRQLLPQRRNLGCRVRCAVSVSEAAR
jgi:hypothetical protein